MAVSNSNDITLDTIEEAITNEYLDILIFNAIKSIRNIKKRPDCLSICDHLSKSPSNSKITENIISILSLKINKPMERILTSLQIKLIKIYSTLPLN